MRDHTYFVTGTDTEVGKTQVSTGLLAAAAATGRRTLAIKPIAAGCEMTSDGLRNDDAVQLQASMSIKAPYNEINPVALEAAIAPHIAARETGVEINITDLAEHCRSLDYDAEFTLVEGAGGWRVPVNDEQLYSALAVELQLPVILVVGMRLGCINHALLSCEAIRNDGLRLAGWVANSVSAEMNRFSENLAYLTQHIDAPLLGAVPFLQPPEAAKIAQHLNVEALFGGDSR